jgi:hypothetical protein
VRAGLTIGVPEGGGASSATGVTLLIGVSDMLGLGVCAAVTVALAAVAADSIGCGLLIAIVKTAVAVASTLVVLSVLRCAIVAVGSDPDVGPQVTTKMVTSA